MTTTMQHRFFTARSREWCQSTIRTPNWTYVELTDGAVNLRYEAPPSTTFDQMQRMSRSLAEAYEG